MAKSVKHIKQGIRHRQKIKDLCFAHYGGYKCAARGCNVTDPRGLTLDHINDDGKKMRKITFPNLSVKYPRVGGWVLYRWLIKHNFPPEHKLQVLCGTHQLIKEAKRRRRDTKRRIRNLQERSKRKWERRKNIH